MGSAQRASETSGPVKVFGRLHDDPIRARRRQAYEKRQGTKSRLVGRRRRSGLYPGLIGVPALMLVDGAPPDDVDGAFKRVMTSPAWSWPDTTRACWHRA
jgi:hypothetical protein